LYNCVPKKKEIRVLLCNSSLYFLYYFCVYISCIGFCISYLGKCWQCCQLPRKGDTLKQDGCWRFKLCRINVHKKLVVKWWSNFLWEKRTTLSLFSYSISLLFLCSWQLLGLVFQIFIYVIHSRHDSLSVSKDFKKWDHLLNVSIVYRDSSYKSWL
jgi:hypothetical protein